VKNRQYTHPTPTVQAPSRPERPDSIRFVKGVGPHRTDLLAQLGVETVEDLCFLPPRRYEDRTRLVAIKDMVPGEPVTVRGRVVAAGLRRARRGLAIFEAAISDGTGVLQAIWFHAPYLARQVKADDEVILFGVLQTEGRRSMVHPELEHVEPDEDSPLHTGRIVPIYPLTAGLSQRWMRRLAFSVVEQRAPRLEEDLPEALRRSHGWPGIEEAVRELHFPTALDRMETARERLAFEELLVLQLALAQRKAATRQQRKPHAYRLDGACVDGLRKALPFALTPGQRRVIAELFEDLSHSWPMYRLLQGDVGCGKTVVVAHLLAVAAQSGVQAAVMAPTELLAEQHARVMQAYLGRLGVRLALFTPGAEPEERRRLAAEVADGRRWLAIGTHALIQQPIAFKRLGLVVIDEQHKFGVAQRAALARKGTLPDVLVLTATPIPRTLALSLYGDLEISTIPELPPGRQPVRTLRLGAEDRDALHALIRQELSQGRQGYIVYPLVDATAVDEAPAGVLLEGGTPPRSAQAERRAATQMAKQLRGVLPEFRIGLLHGQMPSEEKERVMAEFRARRLDLLVSTVIVEVGVDIPNATLMVIEHPERFGLAQLHQLRGRIGRGSQPATCVVVSDAAEEPVRQRLDAFLGTTDGFALAEKDLELRGPGTLLGRQQSGWMRLRIADLARDRQLLEAAREDADRLVQADPALDSEELSGLRRRVGRLRRQPG